MQKSRTFYCYLSGELPSSGLPTFEIIAILKSNKIKFEIKKEYDQVLLIGAPNNICDCIVKRAAYVHKCGELIFDLFNANLPKILYELKNLDFSKYLCENSSFAVRIKKIKEYFPQIIVEKVEREIGREIKKRLGESNRVDLSNPDVIFFGIFTEQNFIFGVNLKNARRKEFRLRAPHTRPFFHPCGLDPFLARAMVNLSEISESKIIYDPFCGTGSILVEAGLIGIKIIGSDISCKMVRGSALNLKTFRLHSYDLFRADAKQPCLNQAFNLITDPPYGRASSIYGKNLLCLLANFFKNNNDLIERNGYNVLALPSSLEIKNLLSKYYFRIQHKFEYYIHRSLTRIIYVIKKM